MEKWEELQEQITNTVFQINDEEILEKILDCAIAGKQAEDAHRKLTHLLEESR